MHENELAGLLAEDLERYFPMVVEYYTPQLFSVCSRLVGSEAEDIVQQTLIHVYGSFKGRTPAWLSSLNVGAYLLKSARNECYKCLNKRAQGGSPQSLSVIHETQFEALFDDPWDSVLRRQDLTEAIQTLPQLYQEVLYLYYEKDLKIKEIAREYGEPDGTIRSRLSRARELLRTYFGIPLEEKREREERHV
ncbi:MAG TPA: sigma-70 family RNA polymerase sigma factor [Ktedonobacteraceae bacterium]|jgi:RNA polymerase sigma-70 factor (ECF subfamily)